ncbi:MAG: hypothetical protein P9M15_03740, partial [Candidatus Electryoneaceae bacterium]|nr:hypothetical protein [Candidatus Electryoneaceae bacterium]
DDNGGLRLSDVGRQMIADAADRNGVIYIHEESLSNNIQARLTIFRRIMPLEQYKVVVNIGGGIASLGHPANGRLIPSGVNQKLPEKNYPNWGVIHYFAESKVPVMQIYDVSRIAERYDLPVAQLPLPAVGVGKVYEYQRYNLTAAAIGLILMFGILAIVKYFDSKRYKWREEKVDPDTIV